MSTCSEENPGDVCAFALSAAHTVLALLRERRDAAGCKLHASAVRQSLLLHLRSTFDESLGVSEMRCKWEMESLLKLYIILWVSLKTECMNFCAIGCEQNVPWQIELRHEGRRAEQCLALNLFTGDGGAAYQCYTDVLTWLVMEVVLPFSHSWEEFNIWNSVTGDSAEDSNNNNNNNEEESCHPFIQWAVSILNTPDSASGGVEWQISPLKQCVVSLVVLLGADALVLSRHPNLFRDAYIRTLVTACTPNASPDLFVQLTRSICRGVIRGDCLYHGDLSVLLETLRRFLSSCDAACDAHAARVQTAVDVLLNTSCPLGMDADIACDVKSVCEWFDWLHLECDYREVLLCGGVDRGLLRSGLTVRDVQRMGIAREMDAAVLLRVLRAHPQSGDRGAPQLSEEEEEEKRSNNNAR